MKKRFFKLALINILSTLTVPLVGLVDTAMLGHLPDIRFLAGVALGSLLFDFLYWTLAFLRMGTTGMTAQAVCRRPAAADSPVDHHKYDPWTHDEPVGDVRRRDR